MDKSIVVGLLTTGGLVIAGIFTLLGGLLKTRADWKLGSRAADTQAASTGATAENARILELAGENKELRESEGKLRREMGEVWDTIGKLRREMETEISGLKKECDSLRDECRRLREEAGQVPGLRDLCAQQERRLSEHETTIRAHEGTIWQQAALLAAKEEKILDLGALLQAAASGQQMAEGAARQAERMATALRPAKAPDG